MKSQKFAQVSKAVHYVLSQSQTADRSSLPHLIKATRKHFGPMLLKKYKGGDDGLYNAVCNARGNWRKKNGKQDNDCRTNRTQFRRNMLNDAKAPAKALRLLDTAVTMVGKAALKELVSQFHSIHQLAAAIDFIDQLSEHFDLTQMK